MTDTEYLELIHAELDGELDARQRSELARRLLADPAVRAVRDDLRRLCAGSMRSRTSSHRHSCARIFSGVTCLRHAARPFQWAAPRWRYAALIAGVLGAGPRVRNRGWPGTGEHRGGWHHARRGRCLTLDTVARCRSVSGRVSLYRDGGGLGVAFELAASAPVDVLIASDGHTIRVNGLGRTGPAKQRTTVALPGSGTDGSREWSLTLLMSGREVGRATLTVPAGH